MVLRKLERRNYRGKWLVSIKYQNLHSFKEGLILLCQSILETRRITHLHGSALFTIPLTNWQANIYSGLVSQGVSLTIEYPGKCTCSEFSPVPEHIISWENELVLISGKMTWEKTENKRFVQNRYSDFFVGKKKIHKV